MQLSQYNTANAPEALCEKILDKLLASLREQYDYIIIDCGLKHELLTINALAAADYCIIPVQAHFLASEGMNYEVYHIPTNFTDAGRVMGLFELRNLVEAVILTLPVLYLCIAFLPLTLSPKIIVTLTIIVPLGGFGLIGISDDSMTRWLGSWWRWRKARRIILFRGEVRK